MRWGGGGLSQLCTLAAHPLIRELISGLDPTLWGSQSLSGEQQLSSLFYINIDRCTHSLIRKLIVLIEGKTFSINLLSLYLSPMVFNDSFDKECIPPK